MLYLYISIGGALGAFFRYTLSVFITSFFGKSFPYDTIFINILGSFFIGFFLVYIKNSMIYSPELKSFFVIGLLGAFTTFSTFTFDIITFIENFDFINCFIYIFLSIVISVLLAFLGMFFAKLIFI